MKKTLFWINVLVLAIIIPLIFIIGWDAMEKWTYIIGFVLVLLDAFLLNLKQNNTENLNEPNIQSNKTIRIMTLQELHELIDEERYSEIFQALKPYYEKITDKTIYNGLRKEYMKGMKSIDYEDRVRTFVNNLEKILPKDSDTTEDKKIAGSEKDNTTNIYIKSNVIKGDNHGKIDNNFS
jgi:hypothetical protein